MEASFFKIDDLTDDTLGRLARLCMHQEPTDASGGLRCVHLRKELGELDAVALERAILGVLERVGALGIVFKSWYLQRADSLPFKARASRDVSTHVDKSVISILVCIAGEGVVSMSKPSEKERPTAKMQDITLPSGSCIVYQSNVTYVLQRSSALYLRCICSPEGSSGEVFVFQTINFPCPHNPTTMLGDVRAYPRDFKSSGTSCCYRGSRWNNVLDHLVNCKANPDTQKCSASQQKRRARNIRVIQCTECDHEPFIKKNTYVQHMGREHPHVKHVDGIPPTDDVFTSVAFAATIALELSDSDATLFGDLSWLSVGEEIAFDTSQERKGSRVHELGVGASAQDNTSTLVDPDTTVEVEIEASSPVSRSSTQMNHANGQREELTTPEDHGVRVSGDSSDLVSIDDTYLSPDTCELDSPSKEVVYVEVAMMLESITKADIRQPAGHMEHNASEISFDGVSAVLEALGTVEPGDWFADVGSGVGNVSIQVALQTSFAKSVCVEMRPELTQLTKSVIARHIHGEPRFGKLIVITSDISKCDLVDIPAMLSVTHIFSHNTLFGPESLLKFEQLCWLPKLRWITLTKLPCSRHRERCQNLFCQTWRLESTISVRVTYKVALVDVFVLSRSFLTAPDNEVEC